ncbi:predicted protein [Naegleria gruberi]|uniref:Predicted protein n=1 Tax=Naegleria gruberi TaxID=5762 RepID=D2VB48_NAEGR|nr:uncharacterized protein NAEGRDRAFT_48114 [Naegleria gruberi]EFC45733.1 predicted protein [Naegleria gruberi]|eukprot:XP_002678477.1 predicted protein [Naegleria gruberi strain NEG-M]
MAIIQRRTATIASLLIIVLWYCFCTQHSIEASNPKVVGVVSTIGTDQDNVKTLYDFGPDWNEGTYAYWGVFNGFQSGTIFFNGDTTPLLAGLNPSNYMCVVMYSSNKPSNEIVQKGCLYSSKQLDIFSATASAYGFYVTVRNLGSVVMAEQEFPPGTFITRLNLEAITVENGAKVVHSNATNYVAWSGMARLDFKEADFLVVVGNAQCSLSSQDTDKLIFEDSSELTLPHTCEMTSFAALYTATYDSMTLGKKQMIEQINQRSTFIKKVIKSSTTSFWVYGNFVDYTLFDNERRYGKQAPFFSYYEIDPSNTQPFTRKHSTYISSFQPTYSAEANDMKIIPADGQIEIYIVGYVEIPSSFLCCFLKIGTAEPYRARKLEIEGDVVFTGIDTNTNTQEVIVTGHFAGTIQIGSTKLTSSGGRDIVVAAFKRVTLDAVWAIKEGGSNDDYSYGIKNNNNEFISIFGKLGLNPKFDGKNVSVSVSTASNGFIAHLSDPNYCYGIASNTETVCNGHGQCQKDGSCLCSSGFGDQCEFPTCNEIHFNETNVCNGHGNCTDYDTCSCNDGWTGANCNIPVCFGVSEGESCSQHGSCISNNTCQCNNGWFGSNCSIHSCNGTSSQDEQNICNNGNGICVSADMCSCNQNWTGQFCEIPKCFGLNSSDISVCSSHGQCINANTCSCNKGWFGADCSIHSCNGTSSQDEQIVCTNGNGKCVSTDMCLCNQYWTGQFCEIPKCFGLPANDSNVCAGHGKCLSPDVCSCNPKWFGAKCNFPSCFGIPFYNSSVCSSHGQCITLDTCKCLDGYDGETCSSHSCFGFKSNNDSRACTNGQGKCTGANQCTCLESESGRAIGPQCETILCKAGVDMWLPQKDPKVCSQHGICKFNMSTVGCFCEEGYEGPICQYPICYGISSNSKKVCNGVGKCNAPNNCSCFDNDIDGHFVGTNCDKCKIPYSGINCTVIEKCNATLKCNSHGTCDDYGFCTCFQDETNGYWNGTNCNTCNDGFYGEDCMTQLSNVHFNNEGNGLLFQMTSPNHFTSLNVDCNNLLDSSSISSFGSNVVCRYSNKTSNDFIIELGTDNSIQVDQEILLNRNVFNRNKLGNDYQSFKIGNAENPIPPTILISQKTTYSSCENILLDASESYSTDGKQISYKWEIVSSNMMTLPNNNSSKLSITYDSINAGSHTFKLTTTSQSLKTSSSKQITFQKLNYATPVISIEGKSPEQIPPSITPANSPPSKLNKGTLLSVQSIVSSASNNIIREWTMNGQSIPSELTRNMRMQLSESDELILDTSSLTEGATYQISFKVTNVDSLLSASLNHSFVINKSPKPCDCQVSPLSGIAMTTIFTFNCPKCQNDQNSNTFEYGFIDDFSKSNFPLSKTEELYQKLPMPNSGNKLDLYVKVIDSLTGSSSITTKQVTISLPVVKSLAGIKKLTASWNQIATLAPVGDYQRSVFNTATISRTMNLLFKSISSKRDFCNGNGQFKDGKCVCNSGFTTSNCKWSTEDFEFIQSLIRDLLNDFMGSSQIMTTASESTNRNYITNLLFGLNSISQNSEYLSNQMVNSSLILLRDALVSVQSSTTFVLSRGDLVNLQNILNLQENLMDGEKLLETVELLGQVLLRNVLIGQIPFKFETNSYLTVLNKHFKNQMNGMKFESEMVNITLPWNISSLLKTNSIKSPIKYRWNIQKNTDTIAIANQPGKIISINSVVNSLQLDPSPQSYSKYLFDIEMKQYDSQAAYVCANIGSASLETDCSISIKNNQIATCECSSLGYNLVILEYKSIENHVSTSSSSNSNIIVKKPPTSNPLMWLLLLLVLIPLTALLIAVIVWFVVKKLGKDKNNTRNPYMQTQESSSTIELKHV